MQYLPTTLLVLLSTRLTSAAPVSSSTTTSSVTTSDCGTICRISHLWSNETPVILSPIVSNPDKTAPIPENTNGAQPYSESQRMPFAPTSTLTHTSSVLNSHEPLSSSYLWSLSAKQPSSNPLSNAENIKIVEEIKEDGVVVAKMEIDITHLTPLHKLPKDEQASFWTTEHASRRHREKKGGCHSDPAHVYLPGNIYIKSSNHESHGMDVVVLGAGVLFLVLLVCVEAAGTIKRHFKKVVLARCTSTSSMTLKQGAIHLPAVSEKQDLDGFPTEQV